MHDDILALIPRRGVHSTKFTSGRVLVAGGSPGLTGAPASRRSRRRAPVPAT